MDQLWELYRNIVAKRIVELESARERLRAGTDESRAAIRLIAHELRGSGGTYGFQEVSDAAAVVEDAEAADLPDALDLLCRVLKKVGDSTERIDTRILIVDDDPAITDLLEFILASPGREITVATTAARAEKHIAVAEFDTIVLDLGLPDANGREVLQQLRAHAAATPTPVIVISGDTDVETKRACYDLGADDFVAKPFAPQDLAAKVTEHLEKRRQGESNSSCGEAGDLMSIPDLATFDEQFQKELDDALRRGESMVLALIRADSQADSAPTEAVLGHIAAVVTAKLRKSDHVARWRGDHLVVLLTATNLTEATTALEKVRQSCRAQAVVLESGETLSVTVSIGMSDDILVSSLEEAVLRVLPPLHVARVEGGDRCCAVVIPDLREGQKDVLLAEDDDLVASIVTHRFERAGFRVLRHANGAEALAEAADNPMGLAILDVKLPEMDGFEVLRNLRGMDEHAETPVIMLTAMGSERDIVRGFKLGADDYMVKPFSPTVLLARAQQLLRKSNRERIEIRRAGAEKQETPDVVPLS